MKLLDRPFVMPTFAMRPTVLKLVAWQPVRHCWGKWPRQVRAPRGKYRQLRSWFGIRLGFDDDAVDVYSFSIARDSVQVIDPAEQNFHIDTIFDIDYADGFGRPDTHVVVFDGANRSGIRGTDSNIADDQAVPQAKVPIWTISYARAGNATRSLGQQHT